LPKNSINHTAESDGVDKSNEFLISFQTSQTAILIDLGLSIYTKRSTNERSA
jgi:hypothetical protein